jgi:hypothetical protein
VDLKAENFRVIYTNFKNASNDMVVEADSVETYYPDGMFVLKEVNYTKIIFND